MTVLHLGVATKVKWINDISKTPVIGGIGIFVLIFIVPVLVSFLTQAVIPGLSDDIGFTKAMLVLLPTWNLVLWLAGIRLTFFYIPAWILFGGIAIVKTILFLTGTSKAL